MGKRKADYIADNSAKDPVDSWKKIFKGLLDGIQYQQRQIESLQKNQNSYEKKIQSLQERWAFNVKFLEDEISQMKRNSKIKDMLHYVETAKANLILSMKQKESFMNKRKFEDADDERADLKLIFEELSQCLAEPKRVTRSNGKNLDESALKAERDFAWNQFKKTDNKLQQLVNQTKSEAEISDNKIQKLMNDLEQSQSSNMEKDRTISALQDDITVLEIDSRKKSEEISRLSKELELLKNNSNCSITPVLRRCNVESNKSHSSDMMIIEKEVRSSKRKARESQPRLFTSSFKVPKLKN